MAAGDSEERWRGRVDATLEGIQHEFVPLRSLPQAMAVMQLTAEREAAERKKRAEEHAKRDALQDKRLARIETKLDKGNRRMQWAVALAPIVVALITVAGLLLKS